MDIKDVRDIVWAIKRLDGLEGRPVDDPLYRAPIEKLAVGLHNVFEIKRSSTQTGAKQEIEKAISSASATTSEIKGTVLAARDVVTKLVENGRKQLQVATEAAIEALHSAEPHVGDSPFFPQTPNDLNNPPLFELTQSFASLTQLVDRPGFVADASIGMALESVKSILMKRIKSVTAATDQLSAPPDPTASDVESMIDTVLAKQEERHQKAIRDLLEGEKIDTLIQVKIDYALSKQNEEHDRVVQNLEHRYQQELREVRLQLAADLAQQHERHQLDLKVVRHDILDLEQSILQAKSAPSKSRSTTKPVDHAPPRASLASRGSMWGHKLFEIPPVKAAVPPSSIKPVDIDAPAGPAAAGKKGMSQQIIIDMTGSDDDESTVSAISDDDICILEPTEAEALLKSSNKLAKGSSKPSIKTSSSSTSDPAPQSPTFDNTGPLAVSPSQLNRLMRAALLLNAEDGRALLDRIEQPDNTRDGACMPFSMFMAEYHKQVKVKGGYRDQLGRKNAIWRQLRAIMYEPMQAGSSGGDIRPPLWEGCGPQGIGEERK